MAIHRFAFPTEIHFGPGARGILAGQLEAMGVQRPLVVTDRGVSALPFFAELVDRAGSGGSEAEVFDAVSGDPVVRHVDAGVAAYHAHRADGVVAVGGGAAIDVAKAVRLMATHEGHLFDYRVGLDGARAVTDRVAPMLAVPTTAGTGSEVGRSAVISDPTTHVKHIVTGGPLLASVVVADPELTVDLPPPLTAATGIDALTHNVEAYLARDFHPICDGIALEGVRLVASNLVRAVAEPHDVDARGGMLMASMMGAIAFQKGLGVVHSCAHALGTVEGVHHGLANGLMIDHALVTNVEVSAVRLTALARAADLDDASAGGLLRWLADLKAEIGIPRSLADTDVDPSALPRLVEVATADACHLDNPRPVTSADFETIFIKAFE